MSNKHPSPLRRSLGATLRALFRLPGLNRAGAIIAAEWRLAQQQSAIAKTKRQLGNATEVRAGPFQGMAFPFLYGDEAGWLQKILGAYENELHAAIVRLCHYPYSTIVNIGAAEGYYSVGLARRLPAARVIAYETNPAAQDACRALAKANDVAERITLEGRCTAAALNNLRPPPGPVLLLADCEGAELDLLTSLRSPWLNECDLVIEAHESGAGGPGAFEALKNAPPKPSRPGRPEARAPGTPLTLYPNAS